jgi:hypothetical protein
MYEVMRRLHPRGTASTGITVDPDGATLGPDCVLVRRTAGGYRCVSRGEAGALQEFLFGDGMESGWLFGQCRRIAEALDSQEIALAQIFGLRIPLDGLDREGLRRLALAAPFIKANFNPDEPRIPAGQPGGGEWTTGTEPSSQAPDTSDPATAEANSDGTGSTGSGPADGADSGGGNSSAQDGGFDAILIPAAYQDHYHDEVVELLRQITVAGGGGAVTQVPLTAVDGTTAIADLIVYLPGHGTFAVEVKTGENPTFTPAQRRIYPMLQVGGHVTSSDSAIAVVGLAPGQPLPPVRVLIYWAIAPGRPVIREWLPPPEFIP